MIALRRKALWEALEIGTVIVDHEVLLDPAEAATAEGIQLVGLGRGAGEGGPGFGAVDGGTGGGVEVAVICGERSVGPVSFDESASGGPVVGVPKGGVDSHWLSLGKRYAHRLRIPEFSYWIVVH